MRAQTLPEYLLYYYYILTKYGPMKVDWLRDMIPKGHSPAPVRSGSGPVRSCPVVSQNFFRFGYVMIELHGEESVFHGVLLGGGSEFVISFGEGEG